MGWDDYNHDQNAAFVDQADFSDDLTRKNFTKKVLGILGIQLTLTFGLTVGANAMYQAGNLTIGEGLYSVPLVWTSLAMSLILMFGTMCCCSSILRKVPHNFIFLLVWTVFESHLISFIGLRYDMETVCSAMGATAGIVLFVALLVTFTSFDFSKLLPIMIAVLFGWILTSLIMRIFVTDMSAYWVKTLYGGIGVTIFTIFLAIDLKMVLGSGKYQYSEDDYVLAAINIYLDIINIFLYLLQIFGGNE